MLKTKVFLTGRGAYSRGRGKLEGQWIELPTTEEEISKIIDEFSGEEYFLTDWESTIEVLPDSTCTEEPINLNISEHENIFELNEFVDELSQLEVTEILAAVYLINFHGTTRFDALENYQKVFVYHYMDLEDVAFDLVETGAFGEVSDRLRSYIDYDKIAHDLECSSELYYDENLHTTFEYHQSTGQVRLALNFILGGKST